MAEQYNTEEYLKPIKYDTEAGVDVTKINYGNYKQDGSRGKITSSKLVLSHNRARDISDLSYDEVVKLKKSAQSYYNRNKAFTGDKTSKTYDKISNWDPIKDIKQKAIENYKDTHEFDAMSGKIVSKEPTQHSKSSGTSDKSNLYKVNLKSNNYGGDMFTDAGILNSGYEYVEGLEDMLKSYVMAEDKSLGTFDRAYYRAKTRLYDRKLVLAQQRRSKLDASLAKEYGTKNVTHIYDETKMSKYSDIIEQIPKTKLKPKIEEKEVIKDEQ